MPKAEVRVDFLGIGAQKAATSWLHVQLVRHPQVWFPKVKETHFWDRRTGGAGEEWLAEFAAAPVGIVQGEITPAYGPLDRDVIREIARFAPDVRVFFCLRNPIERAWSHALMDLVDSKQRRFEDVEPWEFYAHFDSRGARRNGGYVSMLDNWLRVYPKEQLLVTFFEDIRDRPQELLTRIFRHLNVSTNVDWATFPYRERIKEGKSVSLPDEYREHLRQIFSEEVRAVAARLGGPAGGWC